MTMLRHGLLLATLTGCVVGCAQDKPANAPMVTRTATQDDASLVFFDADVFDLSLADELKLGTDRVHVNFGGPTPLNAFPPRMNVWLAEVKKSDGTISVVDPSRPAASRGMFGIGMIFDVIDAINTMQTRRAQAERMALAHQYNARILYDSANGMAREVVFTRRQSAMDEAPPTATAH